MAFKPSNRNKVTSVTKELEKQETLLPKIEVEILPSNFKIYDSKKISYTPYTFGDINRLNQSKLSQVSKIQEILKGINCEFDITELTFADYLYINLLRKISTFGSKKFNTVIECPMCGSINRVLVNESDLEFDEIEVDLPLSANLSNNRELIFSPLTVSNFLTLLEKGLEKDRTAGLAIQVTNRSFEEAFDIIDKAYDNDAIILEEVDKILYHGLKPIVTTCAGCKSKMSANLDGGQTIIYPFRERSFSPRDAIRFGVQKTN